MSNRRTGCRGIVFARDNFKFRLRNRTFVTDAPGHRVSHDDGSGSVRMSHGEISELSRKPVPQLVATSGVPDRPALSSSRTPPLRSASRRGVTQVDVTGDWPKATLRRL